MTASDGLEGLSSLDKDIFDLVITDIKMPKADGFEVLKKVKEISPDTIVIMITAFGKYRDSNRSDEIRCL